VNATLKHYEFDETGDDGFEIDFDPSKYKTPHGAATAFFLAVFKLAGELGYNRNDVSLWNPETAEEYSGNPNWTVSWESGLEQWAVATVIEGDGWSTEASYSFSLTFYKD